MPLSVIALPGRNPQTESWLRAVLDAVGWASDGLVRYRHWSEDRPADAAFEASRLTGKTPDVVVAKSFVTVVASTAFAAHRFLPRAAVLIGTPFGALGDVEMSRLRAFAQGVETLFIQQDADPGGAASALRTALRLSRGEVAAVPGDDHLYGDVALLAQRIREWKGIRTA